MLMICQDASCGVLSIIPNLLCLHGWHTGTGIYEWLGRKLDEKMGSPDATFMEVKWRGQRYKTCSDTYCFAVICKEEKGDHINLSYKNLFSLIPGH